jgi:hypothetical protein
MNNGSKVLPGLILSTILQILLVNDVPFWAVQKEMF